MEEKVASTVEENRLGYVPKRGARLPATPDHTQEALEKSAKESGRVRRNPGSRERLVTSESAQLCLCTISGSRGYFVSYKFCSRGKQRVTELK